MAAFDNPTVVEASSAKTTSGSTAAIPAGGKDLAVFVEATAASGTTPNLVVSVEWSPDGTTWFAPDTPDVCTALTAAGKRLASFRSKAPFARVVWTITGTTPSFTFRVLAYPN